MCRRSAEGAQERKRKVKEFATHDEQLLLLLKWVKKDQQASKRGATRTGHDMQKLLWYRVPCHLKSGRWCYWEKAFGRTSSVSNSKIAWHSACDLWRFILFLACPLRLAALTAFNRLWCMSVNAFFSSFFRYSSLCCVLTIIDLHVCSVLPPIPTI